MKLFQFPSREDTLFYCLNLALVLMLVSTILTSYYDMETLAELREVKERNYKAIIDNHRTLLEIQEALRPK